MVRDGCPRTRSLLPLSDGPDIHDLVAPYALGALDGAERKRFEKHLLGCSRCREELPGLQEAATALALDVETPAPPAGLRERTVASARETLAGPEAAVPLHRRRWVLPAGAGIAAAAACAAVGLGIWTVSLSRDLGSEQRATRQHERALAVLSDPTAVRYPLDGARGNLVVTRAGSAALVVANLKRAPSGKTYELWVVRSLQPQPAGLFSGGGQRALVALTRNVPRGADVAVTLEPAGGSERPTGALLFGARTT